jgi:TfoX N-terminal domain
MAAKQTNVPEDRLALYRRLLQSVPGVAEKSNFGSAYAAVNGHMYTMISKHGIVGLRLPPEERAAFMERYATDLFRGDPAWPPAKEFVAVPDDLLERTDELASFLERSYHYTLTLKPKPTKRAAD